MPDSLTTSKLPKTRYQGSKAKLVEIIHKTCKQHLPVFDTILDVFGGSGILSLYLKSQGKTVIYNDIMYFNSHIGETLLNTLSKDIPDEEEIRHLFIKLDDNYPSFIYDNFENIYFTNEENTQLDIVLENIRRKSIKSLPKSHVSMYLLLQSCIIKRPYNLFHRKNLDMRTRDVTRKFGNKTSWDTSFIDHMIKFRKELVTVISNRNGVANLILSFPFEDIPDDVISHVDTVYLDPPYFKKDQPNKDYIEYYHFLEGMSMYNSWDKMVDRKSINRKFLATYANHYIIDSPINMFTTLLHKFSKFNLVISYNKGGVPSVDVIEKMLRKTKKNVIVHIEDYQYALSKKKQSEYLFIAWD